MYRLRERIRDEFAFETKVRGSGWESLLGKELGPRWLSNEVLKSRCPKDGQNLLMFAAGQGNAAWFLQLVGEIRSRLGVRALVKELQEVDIEGAPLLFHAASCPGERQCFETVRDLITSVLDEGGLMKQVETVDVLGRNIIMHAVRSNHLDTFELVFAIREKPGIRVCDYTSEDTGVCKECLELVKRVEKAVARRTMMARTDGMGMNCLHHAAHLGCEGVLEAVVGKCDEEMHEPDKRGRTPIMYLLRDSPSRTGRASEETGVQARFNKLCKEKGTPTERPVTTGGSEGSWMTPTTVPSRKDAKGQARMFTEVLHAARGGRNSLALVLGTRSEQLLCQGSEDQPRGALKVDLDLALAHEVRKTESDEWGRTEESEIWGRACLLGAASTGGDDEVLTFVLDAIEPGEAKNENEGVDEQEQEGARSRNNTNRGAAGNARLLQAVEAISEAKYSVFSYAILSGREEAVDAIHDLIKKLFSKKGTGTKRWEILSGVNNRGSSSLTCAASASIGGSKREHRMFEKVLGILKEVSRVFYCFAQEQLGELYSPGPDSDGNPKISPLVGAVFSSNSYLFQEVCNAYVKKAEAPGHGEKFDQLREIPSELPRCPVLDIKELHEDTPLPDPDAPSIVTRFQWNLPPVMWRDIEKVRRSEAWCSTYGLTARGTAAGKHQKCSWRDGFKAFSERAVAVAAKRGGFASLRDLARQGFPLHEAHIPDLLENLGDHEDEIVETVLFSVANASNPFEMAALLSRMLLRSEMDHPMHRKGLRRLQSIIDKFTIELLDDLPHTVRGMGLALLGGHESGFDGRGLHQGKHHRLGNLAGFLVVQWMLEPSLFRPDPDGRYRYNGSETVDPLRQALDRGSRGLDLLNSPLALDYMSIKFSCTLPPWTSRDPFQPTVNEGFYTYSGFEAYDLSEILSQPAGRTTHTGNSDTDKEKSEEEFEGESEEKFMSMDFLLRFLQGWDHIDSECKWNFPSARLPEPDKAEKVCKCGGGVQRSIPHLTVLPGLQFSLAGILGRPDVFYQVPVIRFAFEILSYLREMIITCFVAVNKHEHDRIPIPEVMFYVFAAGMVWREVLEFYDGMPSQRHQPSPVWSFSPSLNKNPHGDPWTNRMVSALARYVFYDTWNFLDTLTILCIVVAFVYRIIALDDESSLFYAQFFLALSAPLLFSRLLVLSQIDSTLGPMTQVIWRMMSQTLRFSAFIAMVMLSFALAFFALFHTCDSDSSECGLNDAFGSFGSSFVTVFSSAFDGPDFDVFDQAASDCGCDRPEAARLAGISMMVAYMVVMALVLLNLFVAVLSTAHDEVYVNAEKEYHLARAKLIHQSARVVTRRRPPPPLNLIKLVLSTLADTASEVLRLYRWVKGEGGCKLSTMLQPFTKTAEGKAFDDFLQRLAFALTMGVAAVVLSTILWTVSIPWVAWSLLRTVFDA
ncbi:unnamed protein product, partial [Scytosiphon promiscuus]